jgi:hypothetical protein
MLKSIRLQAMDHQQTKLQVDVPPLNLNFVSRTMNHQDRWMSYFNNRRYKPHVIARAYTKNQRLEYPPPPLDASTNDLFDKFRELVDPEHSSMYLKRIWGEFKNTKDEKQLLTDLEIFMKTISVAGADLWIQHHTLTTRAREAHLESQKWDLGMHSLQVNRGMNPY